MTLENGSLSDFGYRKLGFLPATGGGHSLVDLAKLLRLHGDYESTPDDWTDHWIRRHARKKGAQVPFSIELVKTLSRDTPLDDEHLAFVDTYLSSKWVRMEKEFERFRAERDVLTKIVSAAPSEDRWRGLYRLAQAICFGGPEQIRPILRDQIVPCFFNLYPEGRIVVLRYDCSVDETASILRILYALALTPIADLTKGGFPGVQTLVNWHMASLPRLLPALLDFFNYLFYPLIGGVCAGLPGLMILFLPEPFERHTPAPFPRNWLGFPSGSASFGRERADVAEIVSNPKGEAQQRAGHHRFCHTRSFSVDERLSLLKWYVGRLNRLLYELTDVANFTQDRKPQGVLDPVFGFEHLLTVDRMMRKSLLAMSLDDAPTANLMIFEVADLYDTLSERFDNHNAAGKLYGKTEFFKTLFNTTDGPAMIAPRLSTLPQPFNAYFADLTAQVYNKIEETILESVWLRSKVTPSGVLVRDPKMVKECVIPAPQFVSEVMRAYRNAHHGYFSEDPASRNRPSRYLYLVNGNLPVELSALPMLWWMAYIADPRIVGWQYLEVGVYDSVWG